MMSSEELELLRKHIKGEEYPISAAKFFEKAKTVGFKKMERLFFSDDNIFEMIFS